MKRLLKILTAVCFIPLLTNGQVDPFKAYLDGKAPQIVREITTPEMQSPGVSLKRVTFRLKDSAEVFAVIATPQTEGRHPGILVLHGGGGIAEVDKAIAWAQRGYIAVAPDLPGIAEPKKLTETKGRWNSLAYGQERYVANPDVTSSVIFDAVLSAMKSLYLLRVQPSIDLSRIGVVGISWGGYMTTMVCGLAGKMVRAGFSVYGCGFYDLTSNKAMLDKMPGTEREQWLRYLDAGRRVANTKAAFFIAGSANDFFYWPQAVQATLDAVKSEKNHVFSPNSNHKILLPGGSEFADKKPDGDFMPTAFQPVPTPTGSKANWLSMEVPYMDFYLNGKGEPFPRVKVEKTSDVLLARFRVTAAVPFTKVEVYWGDGNANPEKRKWTAISVREVAKNRYEVQLPSEAVDWFAVVSDTRPVTVSGDLIHCIK